MWGTGPSPNGEGGATRGAEVSVGVIGRTGPSRYKDFALRPVQGMYEFSGDTVLTDLLYRVLYLIFTSLLLVLPSLCLCRSFFFVLFVCFVGRYGIPVSGRRNRTGRRGRRPSVDGEDEPKTSRLVAASTPRHQWEGHRDVCSGERNPVGRGPMDEKFRIGLPVEEVLRETEETRDHSGTRQETVTGIV